MDTTHDKDQKTYEIGYLLTPLVSEEKLADVFAKTIKAAIEEAGGALTAEQSPKMIPLAYEVSKMINNKKSLFRDAYFGAVRFEAPADAVALVKERLDKAAEIVRYLLLVVPNSAQPLSSQKGPNARAPRASSEEENEEEAPAEKPEISEAQIDKEIEGLLTTTV